MKAVLKTVSVIANLLCFAAGIWTIAVTLFKLDTYFVFFIPGMSSAEALFFNMNMFVLGIAGLMFIIPMLADINSENVEFPTLFALIPLIIGIIGLITAFSLGSTREIIMVILSSILYFVLSCTVIYNAAKIFQMK